MGTAMDSHTFTCRRKKNVGMCASRFASWIDISRGFRLCFLTPVRRSEFDGEALPWIWLADYSSSANTRLSWGFFLHVHVCCGLWIESSCGRPCIQPRACVNEKGKSHSHKSTIIPSLDPTQTAVCLFFPRVLCYSASFVDFIAMLILIKPTRENPSPRLKAQYAQFQAVVKRSQTKNSAL